MQNLTDRVGSLPILKPKGQREKVKYSKIKEFSLEKEAGRQDVAPPPTSFKVKERVAQEALPRKTKEEVTNTHLRRMR